MRSLCLTVSILLLSFSAIGQSFGPFMDVAISSKPSSSTPALTLPYNQHFDGGSLPANWTQSGSSFNWTATSLEGTYSVSITNNGDSIKLDPLPDPTGTNFEFFEFYVTDLPASTTTFYTFYDAGNSELGSLKLRTDGLLLLSYGAASSGLGSYYVSQTNYCRIRIRSNASASFYVWLTNAPALPSVDTVYTDRITGQNLPNHLSYVRFSGDNTGIRIDNLMVDTNIITTVP